LAVVGVSPTTLSGLQAVAQGVGWPSIPTALQGFLHDSLGDLGSTAARLLIPAAFAIYVLAEVFTFRTSRGAVRAIGYVVTIYALAVSPALLPWYVILPMGLLVLSPDDAFVSMVVGLAIASRLIAPLVDLRPDDVLAPWLTLEVIQPLAVGLLIAIIAVRVREWRGAVRSTAARPPRDQAETVAV
jgi:hypothetical protein